MKHSPILASIIATCIMCIAYLAMHFCMANDTPQASLSPTTLNKPNSAMATAYVELTFSSPPQSFRLTDPLSKKTLIELSNLTESEWSGEIKVPSDVQSLEYLVTAIWSNTRSQQKNFVHITLSPDEKDDATATLFSDEAIDSSTTFNWHTH